MINLIYKPVDMRYIFVTGDSNDIQQLETFLNKIPQYQYLPRFTGPKTPEVFLHKIYNNEKWIYWCHSGLWKQISDWAESKNITINKTVDNNFKYTPFKPSFDDFCSTVASWNLSLEPYDYQLKAAWMILCYRQSLSELATRSGKTLIAYMVFRWLMEKQNCKNILMIVPSIHLVKQGVKDMSEYQEFFKSETVWAKGEMCESSNLTIGTFQSLVNKLDKRSKHYNPDFFNKFDIVCVDEAHHLICKSINKILSQPFMKNIKLKFGFTGTLPPENTIESFACQSLMGPKIQTIKTSELVDRGFLAKPEITQIYINHPMTDELLDLYIRCGEYLCSTDKKIKIGNKLEKVLLPKDKREFTIKYERELPVVLKNLKKQYTKTQYYDYLVELCKNTGANLVALEQMLVHRDQKRIDVMDRIISGIDKNIIVFGHHTEYIRYLSKHFKEKFSDKKVMTITGSVNLKKREKIINEMLLNNNIILVASYGCMSTGITLKNIDYCIFAQSFKSEIINLQSIGRGLLKTDEKDIFIIYDLVDIWPTKRLKMHGSKKESIYKENKYEYHKIKL